FEQYKAVKVVNLHRHLPLEESNRERVDVTDPVKSVAVTPPSFSLPDRSCPSASCPSDSRIQRNVLIRNQSRELPLPLRRIAASFFRCLFSMPLLPMVVLLVAADLAANESISGDQQLLPSHSVF
ncbi:hypothetical protein ALC60_00244, partial [Trachymyrmex zeteki]